MNLNLSIADFGALSPLLILLGGALIILLLESFASSKASRFSALAAFVVISGAAVATYYSHQSTNPLLAPWLKFDSLGQLFTFFFLAIGLATTLLSATFFEKFVASRGEYFFLLLCSLIGLIFIAQAADFLILFLGIETLSISLYILCGYMKGWTSSHESAFKYFLMGSIASAFLIYGIALVYGALGTTQFEALLAGYQNIQSTPDKMLFLSGIAFITLSISFKATIVPFHVWAPDVYAGAPTPVTAFMAVGTKVGAFVAFMRIFLEALPHFDLLWGQCVAFMAVPTLIFANIVAIKQTQLRRFFAYSGISHAGFLLLPLAAGTAEAQPAMIFYLVIYSLGTFGCFAILTPIDSGEQGISLGDLKGLYHRDRISAVILTLGLLNLAGIPPMAGFFAKFYLFKVAYEAGYQALVIVALLTTILSAFYYLRIIGTMFLPTADDKAVFFSQPARLMGVLAALYLLILSVYPAYVPLIAMKAAQTVPIAQN